MKTVIDAVNELKADFMSAQNGGVDGNFLMEVMTNEYCDHVPVGGFVRYTKNEERRGRYDVRFACTVDEFNACVDELSAATWIDGISLEEWKAGMKNTVIDSHGNELELNKIYEFSDHGIEWKASILLGLVDGEVEYLSSDSGWSMFIRECQSPLGTIKKAPIKLVDGKAYQFDLNGTKKVGVWHCEFGSFFDGFDLPMSEICTRSEATRIIPLVPETK